MRNPRVLRIAIVAVLALGQSNVILYAQQRIDEPERIEGPTTRQKGNASMSTKRATESPLMCNLSALNPQQRKRIRELMTDLRAVQQGIKELSDGYAIGLANDSSTIEKAAEYIVLERLCCPFFDFALRVESESGPVWLELSGREGVKEFAKIEFGIRDLDAHPNEETVRPLSSRKLPF